MKIYILTVGEKKSGFYSLARLASSIGISAKGLKESLPFSSGRLKIEELEVDTKA